MKFENFFFQNVKKLEDIYIKISDRFSDDFIIRPITEENNFFIKKNCLKNANGDIDFDDYILSLVCESVVFPDLKNEALQNSYSVIGEKNLIKAMLTAGEFSFLLSKVESVSGFLNNIEEVSNQLKN